MEFRHSHPAPRVGEMNIQWIALALYAVWLVSELVILRPARDRSGSNVDRRSMLLLASSNMLAPLLSIACYFFGFGSAEFPQPVQFVGVVLMIAGFSTRWSGMWILRKFFSANVAVQKDQRLIIRGPYRLVRHPGYFGGWLGFTGLGLALNNWIAVALLGVLTVPAFLYRIGVEERVLRAAFSNDYIDYSARVKKFIPLVW